MEILNQDPIAIMFIVIFILICIPPILFAYYILRSKKPKYNLQEFPHFLTNEECDKLIQIASTQLTPSKVYTSNSDDVIQNHRTSDQCWLSDNHDEIINKISTLTSKICNKPKENQELLQVVKYPTGGFFNPHYDTCMGDANSCQRMNGTAGPRYGTLLIYLNDDYTGGETVFPNINKTVKPEKGKAVFFYTTDTNGNLLTESLHAGNPVISGNKWICNKWTRINKHNII
jgi:prolyl 4-hydroxylase